MCWSGSEILVSAAFSAADERWIDITKEDSASIMTETRGALKSEALSSLH